MSPASTDELLIRECLGGNDQAWVALLDKYQRLIYSIPVKYGLSHEDASDVFQQVCLHLLAKLEDLREPKSLPAWLIRITSHESLHFIGRKRRFPLADGEVQETLVEADAIPERLLREVEQEELLREAVAQLSPRCRELVRMLFFENPATPYEDVAGKLGIAKGSIGFIRMRCLRNLRRNLEAKGFL